MQAKETNAPSAPVAMTIAPGGLGGSSGSSCHTRPCGSCRRQHSGLFPHLGRNPDHRQVSEQHAQRRHDETENQRQKIDSDALQLRYGHHCNENRGERFQNNEEAAQDDDHDFPNRLSEPYSAFIDHAADSGRGNRSG